MARHRARAWPCGASAVVFLVSCPAGAQPANAEGLFGSPVALVTALALVALLPFAFMSITAFVKISTVLQIVRGAIGAASVPSNTVVMALAAVLTLLAMAPVGSRIAGRLTPHLTAESLGDTTSLVRSVVDAVREPMRDFLRANASDRETRRFLEVARASRPVADRAKVESSDLTVVVPAFVVTELIEAFALGFALYLPFLIIDLVVANVLLALGMQMMNPAQVSLPFKLLLFVAIDGWGLLAQSLVLGYRVS